MTDLIQAFEIFSSILILTAFVIFAQLAIKSKSMGSFRFQLSIFLLIWVLAEIPHIGDSLGLVSTAGYSDIGLYLHATSMAVFALFVGWRSLKFISIHPSPPAGAVAVPTEPLKKLKGWME